MSKVQKNQKGLLKPTLQITCFSVLGVFVSFLTQIIIAAKFGTTMERDAYFVAIVIPGYITAVLLGSLTVTFVPIFIGYETKKSKAEAWKIASIITNLTFLVLFGISFFGVVFARQLISVTAPGFKGDQLSYTVSLLRIILPAVIFSGLTNLLSSIYYAEHRFLRPAIVPVVNTVLMLLSVVLLNHWWGIKSLAFGYVIGAIASFIILTPVLFTHGRYQLCFDLRNDGVRQVIRVMAPLVLAYLFYKAGTVFQRMIASTLPTGSISYLGYATRITSILGGITTAGIATTLFPVMARSWAENDLAKVREYFAKGVRIIMLVTFPILTVFFVLGVPIIQILFERGKFDHNATLAVASVMLILLAGPFVCGGLGAVVWKGFYLSQKTTLVFLLGITHTGIYLGAAIILSRIYSFVGLAWASTIQYAVMLIMGMVAMKIIYKGLNGRKILAGFGAISTSSVLGGTLTFLCYHLLPQSSNLIFRTTTSGTLGILLYVWLTIKAFKFEEAVTLEKNIHWWLRSRVFGRRNPN